MDLQTLMDAISETGRQTRSNYHLTLGGLIEVLSDAKETDVVRFADDTFPGEEMSYRGYYSDLSFDKDTLPKSVQTLLNQCQKALGATYQGYKGGDFVMSDSTPLWTAPYSSTGEAIIDCVKDESGYLLVTKYID